MTDLATKRCEKWTILYLKSTILRIKKGAFKEKKSQPKHSADKPQMLYDIPIRCNQMTVEERYRERYKSGDTPWDVGQPDFNLIEVVTKKLILSCKVLDIGCGTGDNSIWLAQNRFQVMGTDTSDIAIELSLIHI